METENNENTPLSPKQGHRRRILLSVCILLLIGAMIFWGVYQFMQRAASAANVFSPASTVSDLPTDIHWQQVLQHNSFPTLTVAPSDPATLYICNSLNPSLEMKPSFTRSRDAGAHWQVLTLPFSGNDICEVAVNPANASDLYMVLSTLDARNGNSDINTTFALKQSSDSGQTWTDVAALLALSAHQRVAWAGYDLTFVGQRLFATQVVDGADHLISSSDGGRIWHVVDGRLFGSHQALQSYAIDPSAPDILYELVGPIVTFNVVVLSSDGTPPSIPTPAPLPPDQLYRSTDGGTTWQKLGASVPFGSEIQLAAANPHLLYLGGLAFDGTNAFHMQASLNQGATWQTVLAPTGMSLQNKWFVDATGLLYTALEGATTPIIWRYNPSTRHWSMLYAPDNAYHLQGVTSAASKGGDILWVGSPKGTLYRGTP